MNGAKLYYEECSSAPQAVVLVHDGVLHSAWDDVWPEFTVIAPDVPGIGESDIPKDGLDMKTAAIRMHALAKSLGITKARVVGHDIGLMVAYAYAAQFPAEVEKLVDMDAFLPGVPGWELAYNNPDMWHFRFHGPTPEALVQGREKTYFAYFWNDFAADKDHSLSESDRASYVVAYSSWADASRMGILCVLARHRERLCSNGPNAANDARVVYCRRESKRGDPRASNEACRNRCQGD